LKLSLPTRALIVPLLVKLTPITDEPEPRDLRNTPALLKNSWPQ